MSTLNYTAAYFSLQPKAYNSSNLSYSSAYNIFGSANGTANSLHSANSPITYQFIWENGGMTQADQGTGTGGVRIEGDLVNVFFDIYAIGGNQYQVTTWPTQWEKIATLRKSRDMRTYHPTALANDPNLGFYGANHHRFTVDISQVVADLLSYSLVPINGGAWGVKNDGSVGPYPLNLNKDVAQYGGLNGQWQHENIHYAGGNTINASLNGVSRNIRVKARLEILQADGSIGPPTSGLKEVTGGTNITIINSVPQWSDSFSLRDYQLSRWNYNPDRKFLSLCPNGVDTGAGLDTGYMPKVRMEDQAQWLYGWLHTTMYDTTTKADDCDGLYLYVEISDDGSSIARTCKMVDFSVGDRLRRSTTVQSGGYDVFHQSQYRYFAQNVSPAYINQHNNGNNGSFWNFGYTPVPITPNTQWYRVALYNSLKSGGDKKVSEHRYYRMDSEFEDVYGFVRFHWVNRLGGIDSYTAKRNVTESIEITKETIKRKENVRQWQRDVPYTGSLPNNGVGNFDDSIYSNMYTFGRETLNVEANKNYTVYTDPIPILEARWLEELFTSPNVWIEKETEGSKWLNDKEPDSRPSTLGYWPVLITNDNVVEVDEAEGLVQIQIEYTDSHSVNTQRT